MKNITIPEAKKQPYKMTVHGDTRIDDYYWMRLSDKQKNAEEFDSQTNKVVEYIDLENKYTQTSLAQTKKLQENLFNEIIGRIEENDESVPYFKNGYYYYSRYESEKEYKIHCRKKGSLDSVTKTSPSPCDKMSQKISAPDIICKSNRFPSHSGKSTNQPYSSL